MTLSSQIVESPVNPGGFILMNNILVVGKEVQVKKTKYVAPKIVGSAIVHPC
jgi:hypothetical protein